jgi:hypothetical protein
MDMPMSADLLTMREYKREVIKADKERRALAGHLALSELKADYHKVVSFKTLLKWRKAVNERAAEIFARLQ